MKHIPEIELQSPEKIKFVQEKKLRKLLDYVSLNSPFYKRLFASYQIDFSSIKSLKDISLIPPTTKDQLQLYNWDFLCVPMNRIIEYTTTSGTLGKPVTIGLTENDLQRLAYNEYISFACADGTSEDIYQLMITLDRQFMAGIAYHEGIRKLGAGLVRVGPGLPSMQLETIQRLKPTALVAVPSFILKLIEFAQQNDFDLNSSSVRKAICIGENIRTQDFELNTIGNKIKEAWDIQLFSTYASTEMQTAFTECVHGRGGHHHPELLIVEFLDQDNNPVGLGEAGEITVTTLGVEGMPLLRYKTGDIAIAHDDLCSCGRTTLRLAPVMGRKQQVIKLRGTTLYPAAIFEILYHCNQVRDFVVEVFTGTFDTDELRLHVYTEMENQHEVETHLRTVFQSRLRVIPEIKFVTFHEIEVLQMGKKDRKIRLFLDSR